MSTIQNVYLPFCQIVMQTVSCVFRICKYFTDQFVCAQILGENDLKLRSKKMFLTIAQLMRQNHRWRYVIIFVFEFVRHWKIQANFYTILYNYIVIISSIIRCNYACSLRIKFEYLLTQCKNKKMSHTGPKARLRVKASHCEANLKHETKCFGLNFQVQILLASKKISIKMHAGK